LARIGVFGGTFDPIHNGHLLIAREMTHALSLDRVLFVLAARPPHKLGQAITGDHHRLAMLRLALVDEPAFEISEVELFRPGKSFTADTLEELARRLAPASLVFLMGEDSLRDLPNWHDPHRIVKFAEIGVAARPGIDFDVSQIYERVPGSTGRVNLVQTSEVDVSSQEIRDRVASGKSIENMVPPRVAGYIRAHKLYAQPESRT
jgi:nicotinate-nucleotide adenylyltransferase